MIDEVKRYKPRAYPPGNKAEMAEDEEGMWYRAFDFHAERQARMKAVAIAKKALNNLEEGIERIADLEKQLVEAKAYSGQDIIMEELHRDRIDLQAEVKRLKEKDLNVVCKNENDE